MWIYAEKRKKTKSKEARNFCWFCDCQILYKSSLLMSVKSIGEAPTKLVVSFYLFIDKQKMKIFRELNRKRKRPNQSNKGVSKQTPLCSLL